jgi:hypothetical protein
MYRIDTANSVAIKPTPSPLSGEEYFRDGTSGAGDGTLLDADFLNMAQESLIEILDDQSIAHSKTDPSTFLIALRALIDQECAALISAARGHIAGLIYSSTSTSSFEISPGEARDIANTSTIQLASTKAKDLSIAWNEGTGALASGNTITGNPYFGRIFLLGKSSDATAANIGVDTSATATNLLADAGGGGWNMFRQIGWALYNVFSTNTLSSYYQEPNLPGFWRIVDFVPTGFTTVGTTPTLKAVTIPAGTQFFGLTYVGIETFPFPSTQKHINLLGSLTDGEQTFIDIEGRSNALLAYSTTEPLRVQAGAFPNSGAIISSSNTPAISATRYEIEHQPFGFWWNRSL